MCKKENQHYADLILPLALKDFYTYIIPNELLDKVKVGSRVVVQFGKTKLYTAIVYRLNSNNNTGIDLKKICQVIDDAPIVTENQLKFFEWISKYYLCSIGEVYRAALPSGLKFESKSKVFIKNENTTNISETENLIVNFIKQNKTTYIDDINKFLNKKSSVQIIKRLQEKDIIEIDEVAQNKFKPKCEKFISLNFNLEIESNEILQKLKRAKKQYSATLNLIDYFLESKTKTLSKNEAVKILKTSNNILNELIKKEVLIQKSEKISRIKNYNQKENKVFKLSDYQEIKYNDILKSFEKQKPVLLHGVTSSGKTEIYIKLIQEELKKNKQVLYLLPEIAISTQIVSRLEAVFGDKIGVFHSKYSDSEKVELWKDLLAEKTKKIIIGTRSSIFLPFTNLGLIIVDEEHDRSYKQQNPAPRYNARDTALVISKLYKSNIILGTATPSIESYYNSKNGKYTLVELKERYGNIELPKISIADLRKSHLKKQMISLFTPKLYNEINNALNNKSQIIILQNRRGFSPFIQCSDCGWIPKCKKCDVSLSYHKYNNTLRCHYCGYSKNIPPNCPDCGNNLLNTKGNGTEKIEDEIKNIFPQAVVKRMDYDTTKTANQLIRLISDFKEQKIDILVGTQMVSKGFDFGNVDLVGVINADNMMHFSDFRSFEQTFQLITQVSGRAGRRDVQGKIIIQTFDIENSIIKNILNNDYISFYKNQISERQNFNYPPFYKLIEIIIKNKDINKLNKFSENFANVLRNKFEIVLGPESPSISKINNFYLKKILIKISKTKSYISVNNDILLIKDYYSSSKKKHSSILVFNRDPI